ncbi:metallophosphoesterase [Metabacillus fastidiosus]|uniref:Metallophosphoesterase n=1 Tax=Metabacillus fastidiosus TaxID=1458 RepID=A0ABU6P0N8_9BACI|nr:metallophosphoesterase [Metabacillus fastidiosus]MED4402069.1 metallophosphoesterase [Metabacillus fastidiosus]
MKLAILQISDIHLKDEDNSVFKKVDKIGSAIKSELYDIEHLIILITGDTAYSGQESEYELGIKLIENIVESIKVHMKINIKILVIPGNHDCDFSSDNIIRKTLINSVQNNQVPQLDADIITEIAKPQNNYLIFEEMFEDNESLRFKDSLFKQHEFNMGEHVIRFNCFNTSWISELHEQPGKMIFPLERYRDQLRNNIHGLVITTFHHPLHWLEPTNGRNNKQIIEDYSDLVLTGHEHVPTFKEVSDLERNYTGYFEGGALQTDNPIESEFNLLLFDLKNGKQKVNKYSWNIDKYSSTNIINWNDLRIGSTSKSKFEVNNDFNIYLNDVGLTLNHPKKKTITLEDIYVFPDGKKLNFEESINDGIDELINLEDIKKIEEENKYIITGKEQVGKTTFCKVIYKHYYKNGYIPVLIDGRKLNKSSIDEFNKLVYKTFTIQYSNKTLEEFKQFSDLKKLIIIDNFDKAKLNSKYSMNLLVNINKYYKNILITGNELFKFQEFLHSNDIAEEELPHFDKYEIMSFGHRLRGRLINKWNSLGDVESLDEKDLISRNDYFENTINTIIGNNYVPSVPFFLLVILQSLESGNSHNLSESTYGYYYEHLIRQAFININIRNEDIDAFYNYITELAFVFFNDKDIEKNGNELLKFHNWFAQEYILTIDFNKNISKLLEASVLENIGDVYRFKYKYTYYYFVARYLSINITETHIRKEISNMCSKLYLEEYANIIMFLTHLSKDPFILNELLINSEQIFNEFKPAQLGEDVINLNKLIVDIPKLIIEDKDVQQHREEKLYEKDQIERSKMEISPTNSNESLSLESELDIIGRLNWSFKTLEILGQVLKNYYGSIKGKQKITLATEAYYLGLRSLGSFLSVIDTHSDSIIKEIEKVISEKNVTSKDEITKIATHFVFNVCSAISFQFIKKVSSSVGSDQLADVFERVLQDNNTVAVNLIDLSIKLDHIQIIPFKEISEIKDELKKNNIIGYSLLRGLLVNHLYMFNTNFREKQRICDMLNISIESQRKKELLLANRG